MIKNRIISSFFGLSIVFLFIAIFVGGAGLPSEAGGPLILRFDKMVNQADIFGGLGTFFGLWGLVAFMILINFLLAREIYNREQFLSHIIAAASLIITFLFLLVASGIATIN